MGGFEFPLLFDNCIGRKRSVGDDVLADVGKPALKETTAYYVFKSHHAGSSVKVDWYMVLSSRRSNVRFKCFKFNLRV